MIFKSKIRKLLVCKLITWVCAFSYFIFIILAIMFSFSGITSTYSLFMGIGFLESILFFLSFCVLLGICYFSLLLAYIDKRVGQEYNKIRSYKPIIEQEQKPIKIFKINEYITLKLENDFTKIYVNEEEFKQCKYLLLNIQADEIFKYDEINSIDDISKNFNHSLELGSNPIIRILPDVEFFGHCSNIQAWVENNYDTRILHSNLSFPLLKRLTEVGDIKARRVFKEEIATRYTEGNLSVREFLNNGNYLGYLNIEEILVIVRTVLEKEKEIISLRVILKEKNKNIGFIGSVGIELSKHFLFFLFLKD